MTELKWNFLPLRPTPMKDILFTDGKQVFYGWQENTESEEELSFYSPMPFEDYWPENIIAWAEIPLPPKSKDRYG